ncbi:SAM-dependent methyltransferase [Saccharopolyspora sp. 5N708]|uniref:SAM-dependent methyltransferase n=1 Tax=Saccharopolyspora sp. 5N708 TaxID=3457424 RepID=UPI003FD365FB
MDGPRLPEGVGLTALFAAYARAQESRRPDRLFVDLLAEEFVARALGIDVAAGSLPRLGPAREDGSSHLWNGLYACFSGRTGFYDEYVTGRVNAGCRQLAILGAGLDTRVFRLSLSADTVVYEVDTPEVLSFKEKTLADLGTDNIRYLRTKRDRTGHAVAVGANRS